MAVVVPNQEKRQRSVTPLYLQRILSPLGWNSFGVNGDAWRRSVQAQPIATICRETLLDRLSSLDYRVDARIADDRNGLKPEINYYSKLLDNNNGFDFLLHSEGTSKDLLDLPFGGAVEVIREGDDPNGKVLEIVPIDGATLYPTNNAYFPVYQYVTGFSTEPVYYPYWAINRTYLSPRKEIRRTGWGYAPPERIYKAMEMISRGDWYYANLLIDTPEAGILDLGDIDEQSAKAWISEFKALVNGSDPFKVPVLYGHTSEAKFISFGRPPTEILFDTIMQRYTALVCAAYGMNPSDIGLGGGKGGESLAGAIRSERSTRTTGFSILKKKLSYYFNAFLPEGLTFLWIDPDGDELVNTGRARLATATAFATMVEKRMFTPNEGRQQSIADGIVTIPVPDSLPGGDTFLDIESQVAQRPGILGQTQPPSSGGQGETVARSLVESIYKQQNTSDTVSELLLLYPNAKPIIDTFLSNSGDLQKELDKMGLSVDNQIDNISELLEEVLEDLI